jgi:hypothetical protein
MNNHNNVISINSKRSSPASQRYLEQVTADERTPRTAQTVRKQSRVAELWENTRVAAAAVVLGVSATAGTVAIAHELSDNDKLPQPTKTGVTVRIYPHENEGENQLVNDLKRQGVDSDAFRQTVEAVETEDGILPLAPIEVDSGFLTTDQDVLLQYGVQPQDLAGPQPQK